MKVLTSSLLVVFIIVFMQTPQLGLSTGCRSECSGTTERRCRRGEQLRMDAVINMSNGDHRYASFCVKVDDFSQIVLHGSWEFLSAINDTHATLTVHAAGHQNIRVEKDANDEDIEVPDPRLFWTADGSGFVAFYTLLVQMDRGVVQRLYFDNTCRDDGVCRLDANRPCVNNTDCSVERSVFDSAASDEHNNDNNNDDRSPDMRSFIGFVGTDRNRNTLLSAESIPTRFRSFSFGNTFNNMYEMYNDARSVVPLAQSVWQKISNHVFHVYSQWVISSFGNP